jgi:hypothetical protein
MVGHFKGLPAAQRAFDHFQRWDWGGILNRIHRG